MHTFIFTSIKDIAILSLVYKLISPCEKEYVNTETGIIPAFLISKPIFPGIGLRV
jgi:hypothetical protein